MENNVVFIPITLEKLTETIEQVVSKVMQEGQKKELEERLLSPSETCKLFQPAISRVTLHNWEREGKIIKHTIGRNVFYKYSEIMEAIKTVKRYQRSTT